MIATINENGNEKFKTDQIRYVTYKSKENNYKIREIEGRTFIEIGHKEDFNIINGLTEYSSKIKINEWEIVNSLIKLYEKMPKSKYYEMIDKFYIQDNKIFKLIEEELKSEHIEMIIKWCEEYGLPFVGESGIESERRKSYKWFGFINDFKTCIDYNMCGFRVGCFLVGIHIIYKTMLCGERLKQINNRMEEQKTKGLDKEMLEQYIRKTTKASQLYYEIGENYKYTMYDLQLYAETTLSAIMYILQLWICGPEEFILKRCKKCNCHFIAKEPRNAYCENPCNKHNVNKKLLRSNTKKRNEI